MLVRHLQGEDKSQSVLRLAPHVIFRSNLSLFSSRITGTEQDSENEL